MIFKSLKEIKEVAGFIAMHDSSDSFDVLQSDIELAEDDLARNWVSPEFLAVLQALLDDDDIADGSLQYKTLMHIRKVIAHKALYTGASKINVKYQKSGIKSNMNQTDKPVREWMLKDVKMQILQDYSSFLDIALRFMEENKADAFFNTWTGSSQYGNHKKFLIRSLDLFEKYYSLNHSYTTFFSLASSMQHVEDIQLKKILGSEFYTTIKAALDAPSAETKTLLDDYLYRIFAYLTIIRAVDTTKYQFRNDGIIVNEYVSNLDSTHTERQATIREADNLKNTLRNDVRDLIADMYVYLNATASDSIFIPYFEGDLYEDPNSDELPIDMNTPGSGFFIV